MNNCLQDIQSRDRRSAEALRVGNEHNDDLKKSETELALCKCSFCPVRRGPTVLNTKLSGDREYFVPPILVTSVNAPQCSFGVEVSPEAFTPYFPTVVLANLASSHCFKFFQCSHNTAGVGLCDESPVRDNE